MNRRPVIVSIVLSFTLLIALPADAQRGQQPGPQDRPGMMAQMDSMPAPMMGMMQMMRARHQQMMQNPMHRASMMAFMLPALADTLGLSEEQTDQLQELKSEAMAQRREHRQQMMAERKEFMSGFEESQPSSEAVRQHLTTMADSRVEQRATMYETAQQMREVLTEEQRETLEGLSPQQRMRQMMSRMPMMDMMKMMRSMRGGQMMGGGMMGSGMMGRSMKQQGGMKNMHKQRNRRNQ